MKKPKRVRADLFLKTGFYMADSNKLSREEAQADWKSRKLENQAASAATQQSSIIQGREELVEKVNQIKRRYKGKHIPCPDSWGGYCLIPEEIEFWQGRFDWIHHRERYVLNNGKWERLSLAPSLLPEGYLKCILFLMRIGPLNIFLRVFDTDGEKYVSPRTIFLEG